MFDHIGHMKYLSHYRKAHLINNHFFRLSYYSMLNWYALFWDQFKICRIILLFYFFVNNILISLF